MANEMKTLSIGGATLWPIDTEARNQIDSKVDDTELQAAVSGALAQAQPNWEAKEGEPGHVLNRTHWVESERVEILPQVEAIPMASGNGFDIPIDFSLELGEKYLVIYNNERYRLECTPLTGVGTGEITPVLGGIFASGGYPFIVWAPREETPGRVVSDDGATSVTIAIYKEIEVVHKLPEEFLPSSIVTRTEFEAALGSYITDVAELVGGDA